MGHGFEIRINNGQPVRAGLDVSKYCITCILDATLRKDSPEEELNIVISGLNSVEDVHVDWLKAELSPGDTIEITVVEGGYDPPRNFTPRITGKDVIAQKLRYYHALKEELKAYLQD